MDVSNSLCFAQNSLGFKSGCWMWMKRVMVEGGRWRLKESKQERLKQEQEVWFQCGVISSLQNPNKWWESEFLESDYSHYLFFSSLDTNTMPQIIPESKEHYTRWSGDSPRGSWNRDRVRSCTWQGRELEIRRREREVWRRELDIRRRDLKHAWR